VLFSERTECDPMRGKALQVSDCGRHAFAAEPPFSCSTYSWTIG
jgi:hypothetical protein